MAEKYLNKYQYTKQRRWTQSARECYSIGCDCSKCELYPMLGDRYNMKGAVLELVRTFGKPER